MKCLVATSLLLAQLNEYWMKTTQASWFLEDDTLCKVLLTSGFYSLEVNNIFDISLDKCHVMCYAGPTLQDRADLGSDLPPNSTQLNSSSTPAHVAKCVSHLLSHNFIHFFCFLVQNITHKCNHVSTTVTWLQSEVMFDHASFWEIQSP